MKVLHDRRRWPTLLGVMASVLLLGSLLGPSRVRSESSINPGAIWTTRDDCGSEQQDVNHFAIGEEVFINGAHFNPGPYAWSIKGQPGHASLDPGMVVASGTVKVSAGGTLCFAAYTVQADDGGEYAVKVGNKGDNYRVDFPQPTQTATSTATSIATQTATSTATQTATSTVTSIVINATATRTKTRPPGPPETEVPSPTNTPVEPIPTVTITPETPQEIVPPTATPVVLSVGEERTATPAIRLPASKPRTMPVTGTEEDLPIGWLLLMGALLLAAGLTLRHTRSR